jgi:hypothetical protein
MEIIIKFVTGERKKITEILCIVQDNEWINFYSRIDLHAYKIEEIENFICM